MKTNMQPLVFTKTVFFLLFGFCISKPSEKALVVNMKTCFSVNEDPKTYGRKILDVASSPNMRHLAVALDTGELKIYDIGTTFQEGQGQNSMYINCTKMDFFVDEVEASRKNGKLPYARVAIKDNIDIHVDVESDAILYDSHTRMKTTIQHPMHRLPLRYKEYPPASLNISRENVHGGCISFDNQYGACIVEKNEKNYLMIYNALTQKIEMQEELPNPLVNMGMQPPMIINGQTLPSKFCSLYFNTNKQFNGQLVAAVDEHIIIWKVWDKMKRENVFTTYERLKKLRETKKKECDAAWKKMDNERENLIIQHLTFSKENLFHLSEQHKTAKCFFEEAEKNYDNAWEVLHENIIRNPDFSQ